MISNVFKIAALCLAISSFDGNFANAQQRQNNPIDLAINDGAVVESYPINIGCEELNQSINGVRTGISMFGLEQDAYHDGYTLVRDGNSDTILVFDRYETTSDGNCGYTSLGITRDIFANLFYAAFSEDAWRQYNAQTQNDLLKILECIVMDWRNPEYVSITRNILDDNPFVDGYSPDDHHDLLGWYIAEFVRNNRPNGSFISDFNIGYAALISYILGINISLLTEYYGLSDAFRNVTGRHLDIAANDEIFLLNIGNGHWQRVFMNQELSDEFNELIDTYGDVMESLDAQGILESTYIPPSWFLDNDTI